MGYLYWYIFVIGFVLQGSRTVSCSWWWIVMPLLFGMIDELARGYLKKSGTSRFFRSLKKESAAATRMRAHSKRAAEHMKNR